MSTKKTWGFDVFDGPSRDRLFDACKYAYDDEDEINLNFKVAICYRGHLNDRDRKGLPMCIIGMRLIEVGHKDDSGHKFNLSGNCKADLGLNEIVTAKTYSMYDLKAYHHKYCKKDYDYEGKEDLKFYQFKAFYDTNTRKGYITFSE